tara:strand:+ start:18456 stop:18743 length:288 start_codon:yes stop_codon:yes gene_type:complete
VGLVCGTGTGTGRGETGGLTDALVDHVDFEGVVFAVDVVLRGRVHVELDELEFGAEHGGGAIDDDFDGGAEVLKFDFLLGDVEDGLVGCECDRVV